MVDSKMQIAKTKVSKSDNFSLTSASLVCMEYYTVS